MKLSSKGRYALRALFDLAYYAEEAALQLRDIAARQAIPHRFLEQIFRDLRCAALVVAKRGPKGGYRLARAPENISVGDVVRALEGPLLLTPPEGEGQGGDALSQMVTASVLGEVAGAMQDCMDRVTLADLCARARTRGLRRAPPERYTYVI
ncbi:MAG: RrF2 family transcriptional regulator [Polyangiales bacterium]